MKVEYEDCEEVGWKVIVTDAVGVNKDSDDRYMRVLLSLHPT